MANHHISPGKKMFTWGTGDFGQAWGRNLTDADGPYIELMAGVYTDNQPDFSWIQPYESKTFSQFWYPVQQIGPAQNANRRAAISLQVSDGAARVGACVTESLPQASLALSVRGQVVWQQTADLAPGSPLLAEVSLPRQGRRDRSHLAFARPAGLEVIRHTPFVPPHEPLPEAMTPQPPPEDIDSIEQLYLTGLHLEQYKHPTMEPEPYWERALSMDPGDARCNNALGLSHLRRGNLSLAEDHFRRAISTWTRRNPNPRDGEPVRNLGLALKYQHRYDEAYDAFYQGGLELCLAGGGLLWAGADRCPARRSGYGPWNTWIVHCSRTAPTSRRETSRRRCCVAWAGWMRRWPSSRRPFRWTSSTTGRATS